MYIRTYTCTYVHTHIHKDTQYRGTCKPYKMKDDLLICKQNIINYIFILFIFCIAIELLNYILNPITDSYKVHVRALNIQIQFKCFTQQNTTSETQALTI